MATAPKTEYQVFKLIDLEPMLKASGMALHDIGEETGTEAFWPVGFAVAHGPKQAIKAVAARLPEEERFGTFRATPTSSWHEGTVTAKPAELAVS